MNLSAAHLGIGLMAQKFVVGTIVKGSGEVGISVWLSLWSESSNSQVKQNSLQFFSRLVEGVG